MEKINLKVMIESVIYNLSNNEPVRNYALKIKLIANYLQNKKFTIWVTNELESYKEVKDLPSYRLINTQIIANILIQKEFNCAQLNNHPMSLASLNDEKLIKELSTIQLKDSVISLEAIALSSKKIRCSTSEYEIHHLEKIYKNSTILSSYKQLSNGDLEHVIFKFKLILLDVFMELNDTVFNDELDFDIMAKNKEVEKIVSHTINAGVYMENSTASIDHTHIVVGEKNTISISSQEKDELSEILNKIDIIARSVDAIQEEITEEVLKIRAEISQPKQNRNLIKSAFNAIKGIALDVASSQIGELASQGLNIVKGLIS